MVICETDCCDGFTYRAVELAGLGRESGPGLLAWCSSGKRSCTAHFWAVQFILPFSSAAAQPVFELCSTSFRFCLVPQLPDAVRSAKVLRFSPSEKHDSSWYHSASGTIRKITSIAFE
jgi:hypothetical protein